MITRSELTNIVEKHLGCNGRLLALSKSGYREKHPKSTVYFNACIYDENLKQVWYGDIDLTREKNKLKRIANEYKKTFYVTPEHPFRSDFYIVKKKQFKDECVIPYNMEKMCLE